MLTRLILGGVATATLASWGIPQITTYIQKQEAAQALAAVQSTYQRELLAASDTREAAERRAADRYEAALAAARAAYAAAIKAAHAKEGAQLAALRAKYPKAVQVLGLGTPAPAPKGDGT